MKIKLLSSFTILLLASLIFFYNCGSNKLIPDVCFNKNILPIFISKCTTSGCHSGGTGNRKGRTNFSTYEGIISKVSPYHPLASEAYTKCTGLNSSMPPSGYTALTNTELEYIKYWIHTGAKNSGNCDGTTCDTSNVTYASKIAPFMNTWCVGCHNPSNAGGGFDLSTYEGVKNSITPNNRLMGSINQLSGFSAMPKGSGKVSSCDIRGIQKWVDEGSPNN